MPLSFDEVADGPTNMARDLALLEHAEADGGIWARVYGWTGPWVTLGRFQSRERDLLPECPVLSVVRPTGGRGVLHGHDITVGLAGPLVVGAHGGRGSLRETYRLYVQFLINALRACDVPAVLGESYRGAAVPPALTETPQEAEPLASSANLNFSSVTSAARGAFPQEFSQRGRDGRATDEGKRSADCFAHVAANDVVDERTGVKVCGCALRMTDRAVLLQASIPIGPPMIDPARVFREPSPSTFVALDPGAFNLALSQSFPTG
ncbi:MAG: hypothetical protein K1X67_24875 [Fimbriimonadaceae bacterium]|nr:hypothetical protein [Fimbriimonadaceae bacterium]